MTAAVMTAAARVCRVVADVSAIEREFDYLVPESLERDVTVGTIVRVPLHGRRVRAWVVADGMPSEVPIAELLPIAGVVSAGPSAEVIELARWTARRWAGPLVAVLRSASPPNIVRASSVARTVAFARAGAGAAPPLRVMRIPPLADRRAAVSALVAERGSTIVLVADAGRARALHTHLRAAGRRAVLLHSDTTDAARSAAWAEAAAGGVVVVGGRIAALAPVPDLAAAVVVDDLDEALQEERVPTWHGRDVLVERARRVGCAAVVVSPLPSTEAVVAAGGPGLVEAPLPAAEIAGWPRIDVVDRAAEAPGAGLLGEPVAEAIHDARDRGAPVVCVVNRRGRLRLQLCRDCGRLVRRDRTGHVAADHADPPELQGLHTRYGLAVGADPLGLGSVVPAGVCPHCGSLRLRALRSGVTRLAEELAALVPDARVHDVDAATALIDSIGPGDIVVGTESVFHRRELRRARPALVAFLDFDQELLAPRVRAYEQAMWLLARGAQLLAGRPRGETRLLVQTRQARHEVVEALRVGTPAMVTEAEIARRSVPGRAFPPFAAVAELTGGRAAVAAACDALRDAGSQADWQFRSLEVLGPTVAGETSRALLRATDADALAGAARAAVAAAHDVGRVRVAVDPPRL